MYAGDQPIQKSTSSWTFNSLFKAATTYKPTQKEVMFIGGSITMLGLCGIAYWIKEYFFTNNTKTEVFKKIKKLREEQDETFTQHEEFETSMKVYIDAQKKIWNEEKQGMNQHLDNTTQKQEINNPIRGTTRINNITQTLETSEGTYTRRREITQGDGFTMIKDGKSWTTPDPELKKIVENIKF
jgi:hypothetical protein